MHPDVSYWLAVGLLMGIENRGRHATGFAYHDEDDGKVYYAKAPLTASEFLETNKQLENLKGKRTVILHTRMTTKGSASNNDNNHPILAGGVVGVHNGVLGNDDEIFIEKGWDRKGTVDSEVLFRYIAEEGLRKMVREVEGDAAIAWLKWQQADPTVLNLAALGGRPIEWGHTTNGGFVFASTVSALQVGEEWGDVDIPTPKALKTGHAMSVRHGQILNGPWACGELQQRSWGYSSEQSYQSRSTSGPVPTSSYLCPDCKESRTNCICDLNGAIHAPYPIPPKGANFGKGVGTWRYLGFPNPHLNGMWLTNGGGGYRVGPWAVPYSVFDDWKRATRELLKQRRDLSANEEKATRPETLTTIAAAEMKTDAEVAEMLINRDDPDDHLILVRFDHEDDDDEWALFSELECPFTIAVKWGSEWFWMHPDQKTLVPADEEAVKRHPLTYISVKSFVNMQGNASMDEYGIWRMEKNKCSSECSAIREGDLYANSNDLVFVRVRTQYGVRAETIGPIAQVHRVLDAMAGKEAVEEESDSDYDLAMECSTDQPRVLIDWIDGTMSVLFEYVGKNSNMVVRYLTHYDDDGMEFDWSPVVTLNNEDLIADLAATPYFERASMRVVGEDGEEKWEKRTDIPLSETEKILKHFNTIETTGTEVTEDDGAYAELDWPGDMSGQGLIPFNPLGYPYL